MIFVKAYLVLMTGFKKNTPNFTQRTVSAMVEVMRIATLPWFTRQTEETRSRIINLARKRSRSVMEEDWQLSEERRLKRKQIRLAEEEKGKKRIAKRKEKEQKLHNIPIVANMEELDDALEGIHGKTPRQVEDGKLRFMQAQIELRGGRTYLSLRGKRKTT